MPRVFIIALDGEGEFEPGFCSVCTDWQEMLVYFATYDREVSMCMECLTFAGQAMVNAIDEQQASRAEAAPDSRPT